MSKLISRYKDIINLPRPPSKHPPMSMHDRAAQFSPFAALNGHEDAISETARRVGSKIELSDEEKELLGKKTDLIIDNPDSTVEITYFVPDKRKKGGAYITTAGLVRKIDAIERKITMSDGTVIPFDDVLEIESEQFNGLFD